MALEACDQRNETWPDQQKDKDKEIYRTPSKSDPRDLWPLRHLIRMMRGHDLTDKKTKTKTNTKTTLETCDIWDTDYISDNSNIHSDPLINRAMWQQSQFLWCFIWWRYPHCATLISHFYTPIQVPILSNIDCQALASDETIESSMLCAGGGGRGANKVGWQYLDQGFLLLNRGIVEDRSLWKRVASTPWRASLVIDFPKKWYRLTSIRLMLKNLPILLNKSKTSGRTCLMCTRGSPLSFPG